MVVAVLAVRVVQVTVHQVVHMIPVRHRLMATSRAMPVVRFMGSAIMIGRALRGVLWVHR
jgi:hypothetical protein